MFDRMAQVNATFTAGTLRRDELVQALVESGLPEGQITVIDKVDAGDWREKAAAPGFLARLFGGGKPAAETDAPAIMVVMAHLGSDESRAGQIEEIFRRFGATKVDCYAAGRVQTRDQGQDVVSNDDGSNRLSGAHPDQERRSPNA